MRWYGQLAVIAVLGAAGYGGWYAHQQGHLAKVPVLGEYVAQFAGSGGAPKGGPRGGGPGRGGGPPPVVDVDTVRTGRIVETREAVGTVRAYEAVIVTAKVSGIVQELEFEEGQKVQAGDVLVRFDADERRADIEAAVADIRRAEAQRNETRTRLDRALALQRSGAGTGAQVEDLTAQLRTLESAVASAEAKLKSAEARLDDLVVRAPFAGRLGTRSVSLGAYVSPGTRITTLDDLSRVRLDFAVPENLIGRLSPGQTVRATSPAFQSRAFEGKVSVVDPRIDPVTRTARLTAEFDNPDEALRPGMFLSVTLEVRSKPDAVVAPEEAVVNEGLRHIVFVVADNKVERRVVRIGQRQNAVVEILEGLNPGETIVVRGVQRVRPGAPVTPKPIGDATGSAGPPAGPKPVNEAAGPRPASAQNAPAPSRTPEPAAGPPATAGRPG